jgi:soluble lytic murein transglycosylase-like protein
MARRARFLACAALVLTLPLSLGALSGCGLLGGNEKPAAAAAPETSDAVPAHLAETPDKVFAPDPSTSPSPSASKLPTKKASPTKKPKPSATTPTVDPNNFEPPACATYEGKAVSKSSAKAALNAAAAKHYWPTSAPGLVVSSDLVRGISWNESGWQSNIINCDGGHGLMQVMPDTVSMINSRFGQAYVSKDYKQNAIIGANYLAWLTKYIGDKYFAGNYSLATSKCKTSSSWCLLNTVIAAYHAGAGAVDSASSSKSLPSADYVYVVRSLMSSCYCDRY